MNLFTDDKRLDGVRAQTDYISFDRFAQCRMIRCKKHNFNKPIILKRGYGNEAHELFCPVCFKEFFPEVNQPEQILQEEPALIPCNGNEDCPAFVESANKCCFCQRGFCDAHGNKEYMTCDLCAQELEERLGSGA